MVSPEGLQSSCQLGCSPLHSTGEESASKLTQWLSKGLKPSTSNRAHLSLFTRLPNMAADFTQSKQSEREWKHEHTEREHPTQKPQSFYNQCHSVQLRLKGKRRHKCRASLGNIYYVLSHFYSLEILRMRLLRLRDVITCPSGRARIQIQVCTTPKLFIIPQYYAAFSDKNFRYGWGLWHDICFAINTEGFLALHTLVQKPVKLPKAL